MGINNHCKASEIECVISNNAIFVTIDRWNKIEGSKVYPWLYRNFCLSLVPLEMSWDPGQLWIPGGPSWNLQHVCEWPKPFSGALHSRLWASPHHDPGGTTKVRIKPVLPGVADHMWLILGCSPVGACLALGIWRLSGREVGPKDEAASGDWMSMAQHDPGVPHLSRASRRQRPWGRVDHDNAEDQASGQVVEVVLDEEDEYRAHTGLQH